MTSRLSSLLVQDGLVSAKRMADAFQRQVIYGGTLDTNLLEMRVVEEDVLLAYLGRASGLPTQPGGIEALGRPSPEVLQIFSKELAERFRAVPGACVDGGVLRVLVADPVEPQDMEALAHSLKLRVEPWITPEFRVMEALELVYGEPMPPRFQRLLLRSNQIHESKGWPPPRIIDPVPRFGMLLDLPAPAPLQPAPEAAPMPPKDLSLPGRVARPMLEPVPEGGRQAAVSQTEEAIEESSVLEERPVGAEQPATPPLGEPVPELIPEQSAPVRPVKAPAQAPAPTEPASPPSGGKKRRRRRGEAPRVPPPAPIVARPLITPPPRPPLPKVVVDLSKDVPAAPVAPVQTTEHTPLPSPRPLSEDGSGSIGSDSLVGGAQTAQGAEEPVPVPIDSGRLGEQIVHARPGGEAPRVPVATDGPRPTPLSPEEARELIAAAEDREVIFETLCRTARSRVAFAAVFTVHGDMAFGRTALGESWLERQGLSKVAIPLDRPSAFRIAVKGRSPHLGRIGEQPAAGDALLALGRRPPLPGAVLPILVRGRTLALLYVDDDGRELPPDLLEEMRPLMIEVSQAFQRLVLRSRASGFTGAAEEGPRGQFEREGLAPAPGSRWTGEHERGVRVMRSQPSPDGSNDVGTSEPTDQGRPSVQPPVPLAVARAEPAAPQPAVDRPTTRLRPEGPRQRLAEEPVSSRAAEEELASAPAAPPPAEPPVSRPATPLEAEPRQPMPTLAELVTRAAAGDEHSAEQLLMEGEDGARAVAMALPGPLKSRERQALGDPIGEPVFARGPLLALVPRFGRAVVQPLLERLDNPVTPPEVRYYVALCFSELPVEDAIRPLGHRLFDEDDAVRMAAVTALRNCPPGPELRDLLETLRSDLLGPDTRRQRFAAEALGELRDVQAVPRLIQLLSHEDPLLASAAARALQTITKQDFGRSRWRWRLWWRRHAGEPRLQWMLSGLGHPSAAVRASAQDELRGLSGDVAGYRFDLPRREREAAQRRWIDWWQRRGYPVHGP
ncbi:MAG: hypothetical protein RMK29_09410 [Myxococcales bacterium]|nr:hypothetical protein [Myxococcota bacterium]MDW8281917.1 hypothetical protein [Myxococcales bacterium]